MSRSKKTPSDELTSAKRLPTSAEVSRAAFDSGKTAELVSKYQLSAVELAQLLDRLDTKPVPW